MPDIPILAAYLVAAVVLGVVAEKGTPPAPFGTCVRFWRRKFWDFRRRRFARRNTSRGTA